MKQSILLLLAVLGLTSCAGTLTTTTTAVRTRPVAYYQEDPYIAPSPYFYHSRYYITRPRRHHQHHQGIPYSG